MGGAPSSTDVTCPLGHHWGCEFRLSPSYRPRDRREHRSAPKMARGKRMLVESYFTCFYNPCALTTSPKARPRSSKQPLKRRTSLGSKARNCAAESATPRVRVADVEPREACKDPTTATAATTTKVIFKGWMTKATYNSVLRRIEEKRVHAQQEEQRRDSG